jgi:hypothetical protein
MSSDFCWRRTRSSTLTTGILKNHRVYKFFPASLTTRESPGKVNFKAVPRCSAVAETGKKLSSDYVKSERGSTSPITTHQGELCSNYLTKILGERHGLTLSAKWSTGLLGLPMYGYISTLNCISRGTILHDIISNKRYQELSIACLPHSSKDSLIFFFFCFCFAF